MDRKQAFKKARSLINKASILYALRDYNLNDSINFPLGGDSAQIIKGQKKDCGIIVEALKAKNDRELNIRVKSMVHMLRNDEIQQVANSVMRILRVSVTKKIGEINSIEDKALKQSTINKIGKTNNACIFILETSAKDIINRAKRFPDSEILEGLSTKMLLYVASLIRSYMIFKDLDVLLEESDLNKENNSYFGSLSAARECQSLLDRVINLLKGREVSSIEQRIKSFDEDIEEYVRGGHTRLFC